MNPDVVLREIAALILGPWLRLWRRLGVWSRFMLKLVVAALLIVVGTANIAAAEGASVPAALEWILIRDSKDRLIWAYVLSLDAGGMTRWDKGLFAFFVEIIWSLYVVGVALSIWLIDWTLSFVWLDWIITPVVGIGDSLQVVVNDLGLVPTFLLVTVVAAAFWMLRGKTALGIYEIGASMVIAALAVTILANPIGFVAGKDGLLYGARDVGMGIAASINGHENFGPDEPLTWEGLYEVPPPPSSGDQNTTPACTVEDFFDGKCDRSPPQGLDGLLGDALATPTAPEEESAPVTRRPDPEGLREVITAVLADTFIRAPHQLINYGRILDGTECQAHYEASLEEGRNDTARKVVADCNAAAGDIADNPNPAMLVSALVLWTAPAVLFLFALVLCLFVIKAVMDALWQALKLIWAIVQAVLPGGARGSFWTAFAELFMAAVTVVFAVVFLTVYVMFLFAVLGAGAHPIAAFFVIDILLLIGIVIFLKARARIKAAAERLKGILSARPGGAPAASKMPQQSKYSLTDAYHAGKLASGMFRKLTFQPRPGAGEKDKPRPEAAPASSSTKPSGRSGGEPDQPAQRVPNRPTGPQPTLATAERVKDRVAGQDQKLDTTSKRVTAGKVAAGTVKVGAHLAAAVATGGGTVAAKTVAVAAAKAAAKQKGKQVAGKKTATLAQVPAAKARRDREIREKLREVQTSPTSRPRPAAPRHPHGPAMGKPGPAPRPASPHSPHAQRLQERLAAARR